MDGLLLEVLDAMAERDWARLKPLLHPYLHWSDAVVALRGRTNLLTHLTASPVPAPPVSYEVRNGQIYRWVGPGGQGAAGR